MRRAILGLVLLLAVAASAEPEAEPAPLGIDLSANEETELTLWPGTPITFVALLENVPAAEAKAAAAALEQAKATMDAAVKEGRVSREEADAQLAGMEAPPAGPPVTVAPVAERFSWVLADGKPSPFAPAMRPAGAAVALDGEKDLAVTFVVAPEKTTGLAPGEYRLRLRYQGKGAPPGEWAGTADSGEVAITVTPAPAEPTAEDAWTRAYALSQYHLAVEDYAQAAAAAEAMLKAVPRSVLGLVQRGKAREGRKDLAGAAEAYREALSTFREDNPGACEPSGLVRTVRRAEAALGGR